MWALSLKHKLLHVWMQTECSHNTSGWFTLILSQRININDIWPHFQKIKIKKLLNKSGDLKLPVKKLQTSSSWRGKAGDSRYNVKDEGCVTGRASTTANRLPSWLHSYCINHLGPVSKVFEKQPRESNHVTPRLTSCSQSLHSIRVTFVDSACWHSEMWSQCGQSWW